MDYVINPDSFVATHKHRNGGEYMLLQTVIVRSTLDGEACVLYADAQGTVWCRPKGEFYDGRFKEIACPRR